MKVRTGTTYRFEPVAMDCWAPAHQGLERGDLVKVIHPHGCPPPNTMGHCHVERDGKFMGLVCCGSLQHASQPRSQA